MQIKILVAHSSNPSYFKHELTIDFIGENDNEVTSEIIDLLNENNFRDCIFKIQDEKKEGKCQK